MEYHIDRDTAVDIRDKRSSGHLDIIKLIFFVVIFVDDCAIHMFLCLLFMFSVLHIREGREKRQAIKPKIICHRTSIASIYANVI